MITTDVVVVGGGVIGASIAFHLARRRVGVVVCDGGDRVPGATGQSAAQVRMHHSDPFDARLAATGLATYESWPETIGGDCGFRRVGFAFLAAQARRQTVSQVVAMLAGLGVETEVLTPEAYGQAHPGLDMDGVGVVAYEPRSGYADPVLTTGTLLARAADHGARTMLDAPVVALLCRGQRITGVRTRAESYAADHVVVAAGVHSRDLLATVDVTVPTRTRRIGFGIATTPGPAAWPAPNVVIDDTLGMYFRPHRSRRVLFGVPLDEWDLAPSTRPADPGAGQLERARTRLAARLPMLGGAALIGAGSALEAYTPDHHAIIGSTTGMDGGYLATGFSGGGFKLAPAVGDAVADELVSGRPRPELAPYRLDRFARHESIVPSYDYAHL